MLLSFEVVKKVMDSQSTGSFGTSGVRVVTRKYLFDRMYNRDLPNLEAKLDWLKNDLLTTEDYSEEQIRTVKKKFAHFKSEVISRWKTVHNKIDVFYHKNENWLNGAFEIPIVDSAQNRAGRPSKSFQELSERSKRRKTAEVRSTFEKEVIVHAAQTELIKAGKRDASKVLKEIVSTPKRATKYRKAYMQTSSAKNKSSSLTAKEALQMFIDADLTREQYEIMRRAKKNVFPCYTLIQKEKKKCYPPPESCNITSTSAEVQLQPLMDLTVNRLFEYLEEVLIKLSDHQRRSLTLISKWGCDGSQQSRFKQKFDDDADSDQNMFQSCFVPLKLVCGNNNIKTVWENPTPSSPRFCRLIRFRFVKENNDITEQEIKFVNDSINALIPTELHVNDLKLIVKYKFIMTMVDGKVCNAATGTTSTSRCYVCGATSKDFNNLAVKHQVNPEAVQFGLSILHARIRLFESILHLAYKLPVKKYRERKTEAEKALEKEKKQEIQTRFRNETGLLVDMPKSNFGNTNDGNTSRRFFQDPVLASNITGINYELIYRFKVILETISSGHRVDSDKYDNYALETAKLYVNLYPWHPMTPTMHKILVHGGEIIKKSLLPIGQLSEEAAEARNKHFRSYRQDFARKFSRETCNRDVFNRLMLSSDPLMSSNRKIKKTSKKSFLPETLEMLMPAEPNPDSSESEDDNSILS